MNIFLVAGITIFTYMVLFYLVARILKDNSIIDIGWGSGFIVIATVLLIVTKNIYPRTVILFFMILLWGLRLTIHIYNRNKGKPEDFRYASWRQSWGKKEPWIAFYKIFMFQGFIMYIVSIPIILTFKTYNEPVRLTGFIGIVLFIAGYIFETVGDLQLTVFRKNQNNKGKIITTGLWKYTRHPNYFGEALLWWGTGIYAVSGMVDLPALISPLVMTLLLRYVSGVPMLERKYEKRKDFADYAEKTPVFIPFIGRRGLL